MKEYIKNTLTGLFREYFGVESESFGRLPVSGSNRKYFRITGGDKTAIGVINKDYKENLAFIKLTEHFTEKGLPVPELYSESITEHAYLQEDLGDTTLFDLLNYKEAGIRLSKKLMTVYKKSLNNLIKIQTTGSEGLDYSICYPRPAFDKQSMMWDLSYFKYYFIKLADIEFYEQDLEEDFHRLTDFLLECDTSYFLYRDFQSRNIMVKNDEAYLIDYQGGRQGALQYDVASLLFDAKADLHNDDRNELLEYYVKAMSGKTGINKAEFLKYYYPYVYVRIMQAFGAFGYRGFFEGKQHFLLSIPYALKNLEWLMENHELPFKAPELNKVLRSMLNSARLKELGYEPHEGLKVNINSFSYKRAIPGDSSGNGGGYVFDCRSLPNPGRLQKYQALTGKDKEVIKFLESKKEVENFLNNIFQLVDMNVDNYIERNFKDLMVSFGCTGGQHRSVYCAEKLAKHLSRRGDLQVVVKHVEQEKVNKG